MKIKQMTSPRSGRPVPNQFVIYDDEDGSRHFQSYNTVIAIIDRHGKVTLDPKWNCSQTTSKYRSQFLGENTRRTAEKIKLGEHKVEKLN